MNHISLSKGMPRCPAKAPTHMCFAQYQMHTLAFVPSYFTCVCLHNNTRYMKVEKWEEKKKQTNNKQLNKHKENNNNKTLLLM